MAMPAAAHTSLSCTILRYTVAAMSDCLIVTTLADEFVAAIAKSADRPIDVKTAISAEAALLAYDGEEVIFGNPAMIAEILSELPGVCWVQSSWAGVTPLIDHPRRDYVLTGVKDVFGPQMSEYVVGYLLAHELKVHARRQAQRTRQWSQQYSGSVAGKKIGIMGTGSIGRHIARTARCLDMSPIGLSRSGSAKLEFDKVFSINNINSFIENLDYLVSTLPDTPETQHLLDEDRLSGLPEGAVFINVGRSNVVDDRALIGALQSGRLAGATLDVFDEEPLPDDSPMWEAPNLNVTAHIAAISHPLLLVPVFLENYRRYAAGEPLQHVVDFQLGY